MWFDEIWAFFANVSLVFLHVRTFWRCTKGIYMSVVVCILTRECLPAGDPHVASSSVWGAVQFEPADGSLDLLCRLEAVSRGQGMSDKPSVLPNTNPVFSIVLLPCVLQILSEWFGRSVICSCIKLSYDHAQSMIESPDKSFSAEELPPCSPSHSIQKIQEAVINLHNIAKQLRAQRFEGGALRLDQVRQTKCDIITFLTKLLFFLCVWVLHLWWYKQKFITRWINKTN